MEDIEHDCNRYLDDNKVCFICHTRFDLEEIKAYEEYFTDILHKELSQ